MIEFVCERESYNELGFPSPPNYTPVTHLNKTGK